MQDKSCLAPKVNMENSSEIGEKPFCGKEMRRALGLGFLRHRDLTSLKKKKNTSWARSSEGKALWYILTLLSPDLLSEKFFILS